MRMRTQRPAAARYGAITGAAVTVCMQDMCEAVRSSTTGEPRLEREQSRGRPRPPVQPYRGCSGDATAISTGKSNGRIAQRDSKTVPGLPSPPFRQLQGGLLEAQRKPAAYQRRGVVLVQDAGLTTTMAHACLPQAPPPQTRSTCKGKRRQTVASAERKKDTTQTRGDTHGRPAAL